LGIAQICLLLTVLVFMGLTRGTRGEMPSQHAHGKRRSIREWGKRTLSLSGMSVWPKRGRSHDSNSRGQGKAANIVKKEEDRGWYYLNL
jgi:hypothetical protein